MLRELATLRNIRAGGRVQRLHTQPVLKAYSVAEHSFNALAIALVLLEQANGTAEDIAYVTKHVLVHDVPEQYTGDIPAPAKVETPALGEILDSIEAEWMKNNIHWKFTRPREHLDTLVKAADTLELLFYCVDERRLGNQGIGEVYRRAMAYTVELLTVPGVQGIVHNLHHEWKTVNGTVNH